MLQNFLSIFVGVGPYLAIALLLPLLLIGATPWAWRHPTKWIFWVIFLLNLMPDFGGGASDGSLLRQIIWGTYFFIVGAQLIWDRRSGDPTFTQLVPTSMLVLMALIFISIVWSPEPFISFKRAALMVGVLLLSVMTGRAALRGELALKMIIKPAAFFILVGLCTAVVAPQFAFGADHALRAISSHKNTWGQFSLVACLVFLNMTQKSPHNLWLWGFGFLPAIASLFLSRSTTSILAFVLIFGSVLVWQTWSAKGSIGKIVVICSVLITALALHGYFVITGEAPADAIVSFIFNSSGKDATLTGRANLWSLMDSEIRMHPWFGTGYGGFWTNKTGPSSILTAKLYWGPPTQAHSGYIDLVNELGVVGALVMSGVFVVHIRKLLGLLRQPQNSLNATFHITVLLAVLIVNYAETSLLRTTHIMWIILSISIFEVHALSSTFPQTVRSAHKRPLVKKNEKD